jgi:hypothetical protein
MEANAGQLHAVVAQSGGEVYSKIFKRLELIPSKEIISVLQKFQIKYGFIGN